MNPSRLVFALMVATAGLPGLLGCSPEDPDGTNGTGGTGTGTGGGSSSGGNSGSGGTSIGSGGSSNGTGGSTVGSGGAGTGSGGSVSSSGGAGTGGSGPGSGGATATGGRGGGNGSGGSSSSGGSTGSGGASGGASGSVGAVPLDSSLLSRCTGTSPIICTIPVPNNGNYTVTVELGSANAASTSRVQAELYRIVVPEMTLAAGTYSQQTFSVNVRAEDHDGYEAVGKELNLRIDGPSPALRGLGYAAATTIPTIFIAGDSTVCDWDPVYAAANAAGPLERGWAQELSQFFKPGIAVANYADSGETASGFYGKFWGPAKSALREGDYVFVQFGHNDQKSETTANFKTAMMRYITDARNAKATPVLLTPPGRKGASTGDTGFAGFDQATRELASSANVLLVDLTKLSIEYYKTVPDKSVLFATSSEGTHFSEIGATALSKVVTTELKAGTLPLKDFIK